MEVKKRVKVQKNKKRQNQGINYQKSLKKAMLNMKQIEPQLTQRTVLVDVDDESIIQVYENAHINQEESEDLTSDFFTEVKGKPYTLKRKYL